MLWDDAEVNLKLTYNDCFFVYLSAKSAGGLLWDITVIYTSPIPSVRRFLWDKLDGIRVTRPWVLVGDVNCMLF